MKVAFYNTELVDDLWLDNLNREGVERTGKRLGFTRDERGGPKFVAPGVIADDDRRSGAVIAFVVVGKMKEEFLARPFHRAAARTCEQRHEAATLDACG